MAIRSSESGARSAGPLSGSPTAHADEALDQASDAGVQYASI